MKATIEIELLPFNVPNYVRTKREGMEEGVDDAALHLRDLDAETLDELCENFTNEVFKRAKKQRPPTAA